jgi:hypothetical protein
MPALSLSASAAAPPVLTVVLPRSARVSSACALHASKHQRSAAQATVWRNSSCQSVYAGLHRTHSALPALHHAVVCVHQQQCIPIAHAAACFSPSCARSLIRGPAITALCCAVGLLAFPAAASLPPSLPLQMHISVEPACARSHISLLLQILGQWLLPKMLSGWRQSLSSLLVPTVQEENPLADRLPSRR